MESEWPVLAASQVIPRNLVVTQELLLIRDALIERISEKMPAAFEAGSPVTYIEETEEGLRLTVEVAWV